MMLLYRTFLMLLLAGCCSALRALQEKTLIIHQPEQARLLADTSFLARKDACNRALEQKTTWTLRRRSYHKLIT